jgi:hypothetical protein
MTAPAPDPGTSASDPAADATPDPTPDGGETAAKEAKSARTPEEYEAMLAKVRREAAGYRMKLKESEPLVKKALEAEEASKTDIQRANERATKAEAALQERDIGFARLELAVKYSVQPEDIDLIGSGTREEMDARAKRIAALNAAASKAAPPPTDRPVEGLRPGATPEPPKPADDSYPASWTPSWVRDKQESRSFHGQ